MIIIEKENNLTKFYFKLSKQIKIGFSILILLSLFFTYAIVKYNLKIRIDQIIIIVLNTFIILYFIIKDKFLYFTIDENKRIIILKNNKIHFDKIKNIKVTKATYPATMYIISIYKNNNKPIQLISLFNKNDVNKIKHKLEKILNIEIKESKKDSKEVNKVLTSNQKLNFALLKIRLIVIFIVILVLILLFLTYIFN